MYSFAVPDVNEALQYGIEYLLREGVEEQSRFGPVLAAPEPVCIEYAQPRRRVLLSPTRDANPYFHFIEALWMLAGDNDIWLPCQFSSSYGQFSDDGVTMWDAYGWRWRKFFGWDQPAAIVAELRANPQSRRCVLSMWNGMANEYGDGRRSWPDAVSELRTPSDFEVATHGGKAVPCNTHAYFAIRNGKLNMTVCNRSNDALWGCFGANAVHFSFLQEYLAAQIGVPVGTYYQFTNNLHLYTDKFSREKLKQIAWECETLGTLPGAGPEIAGAFDSDLALFMPWARKTLRSQSTHDALDVPSCQTEFMQTVAVPVFLSWFYRRKKDEYSMHVCLDGIAAPDWQRACCEWVDRRQK